MKALDKIAFPYRSPTHLSLLHVIAESGAWEKYGLDVEYDRHISSGDSHDAVAAGDVEFVGGNHVSTYGRRARGDKWVYLGQTLNSIPYRSLCVRPDSGITGIADLRHKTVGTSGNHPSHNDWLTLKQHGLDGDRDDLRLYKPPKTDETFALWKEVQAGTVDACFVAPPRSIDAARAGMKLIDVPALPMIWFTTISSGLPFVQRHPKLVEAFLKGLMEGIHFFKTQPARAKRTIQEHYTVEGRLDDEKTELLYRSIAEVLEPKLYPTPHAIANVYEEGLRQDKDAAKVNPMELWDLQFLRELDDAGFVAQLWTAPAR